MWGLDLTLKFINGKRQEIRDDKLIKTWTKKQEIAQYEFGYEQAKSGSKTIGDWKDRVSELQSLIDSGNTQREQMKENYERLMVEQDQESKLLLSSHETLKEMLQEKESELKDYKISLNIREDIIGDLEFKNSELIKKIKDFDNLNQDYEQYQPNKYDDKLLSTKKEEIDKIVSQFYLNNRFFNYRRVIIILNLISQGTLVNNYGIKSYFLSKEKQNLDDKEITDFIDGLRENNILSNTSSIFELTNFGRDILERNFKHIKSV